MTVPTATGRAVPARAGSPSSRRRHPPGRAAPAVATTAPPSTVTMSCAAYVAYGVHRPFATGVGGGLMEGSDDLASAQVIQNSPVSLADLARRRSPAGAAPSLGPPRWPSTRPGRSHIGTSESLPSVAYAHAPIVAILPRPPRLPARTQIVTRPDRCRLSSSMAVRPVHAAGSCPKQYANWPGAAFRTIPPSGDATRLSEPQRAEQPIRSHGTSSLAN